MLTDSGSQLLRLAFALTLASCEPQIVETDETDPGEPSPNASILPAPLVSVGAPTPPALPGDAGVRGDADADADAGPDPLVLLLEDRAPALEAPSELDAQGVHMQATFRWHNARSSHTGPEVSEDSIQAAREMALPKLSIQLSFSGRMRITLEAPSFALPQGTEIRGQRNTLGHVLVWPDAIAYRVLRPGTFRALLQEGRADATPLVLPRTKGGKEGSIAGYPTSRTELQTSLGTLLLDQSRMPLISGAPLCRLLVVLIGAKPESTACSEGLVPLAATAFWPDGGRLGFEVTSVERRLDLEFEKLTLRVPAATFKISELPQRPTSSMIPTSLLQAFRKRSLDLKPATEAPQKGLLVVNRTRTPRVVFLDGVPAAWVGAGTETHLEALQDGRYVVQTRDFLGISVEPGEILATPHRLLLGGEEPDAGQ